MKYKTSRAQSNGHGYQMREGELIKENDWMWSYNLQTYIHPPKRLVGKPIKKSMTIRRQKSTTNN